MTEEQEPPPVLGARWTDGATMGIAGSIAKISADSPQLDELRAAAPKEENEGEAPL